MRNDSGTIHMQDVEIRIKGHIDSSWADWLDGLTIIHTDGGDTLLKGPVGDQSVLYGVLNRIASLGMQLVSVNPQTNPKSPTANLKEISDHELKITKKERRKR